MPRSNRILFFVLVVPLIVFFLFAQDEGLVAKRQVGWLFPEFPPVPAQTPFAYMLEAAGVPASWWVWLFGAYSPDPALAAAAKQGPASAVDPKALLGTNNEGGSGSSDDDAAAAAAEAALGDVEWIQVFHCLPRIVVGSIVVALDAVVKQAAIKESLHAPLRFERETYVAGLGNFFCGLFGGPPSYSQLKLVLLNTSVVGSIHARMPGLVMCLLLAACIAPSFEGVSVISYFPRFFISGALFFVGIDLIYDNLVAKRASLPRNEANAVLIVFSGMMLVWALFWI